MKLLRARCAERSGTAGTVLSLDPFVVACGAGSLELTEVQPAGKKPATAGEFLRGARLVLNDSLT
jgi:methionyl-tRNA formyltransferase